MVNYIVPIFIIFIFFNSLMEKKNAHDLFIDGIKEGMKIVIQIFPIIFSILIVIEIYKNTNLNIKINLPLCNLLPLILVKPFSGAAAMAMLIDLYGKFGVDSYEGILGSILIGSSETTFYAISTYFGVTKVKKNKNVIIAGVCADIALLLVGIFIVNKILF